MTESRLPGGDAAVTTEDEPVKAAGRFRTALPQVLASTAKNMLLLDLGMTVAFPTIVIPALHNTLDPLALNDEQTSWFGSIMYICQPVGSILSGIVLEQLGRKKSMILVNFPHVIGWFIFYFASSVPMLYLSAVVMGLGVGFMEAPIITYVGEISQPELRGVLTSYSGIFVQLGFFLEYLLGTVSNWRTAAAISSAVPIATVLAITQVPETPIWLLSRGRFEEAEKSLCWLRGWVPPSAVSKEFNELVLYSEQVKKLKHAPSKSAENGNAEHVDALSREGVCKRKIRQLLSPQTLRPLFLVLMFFFFQHCSGFTAIRPYMVQVFDELGLPFDAHWVTVLTGVVGLVGNIVCMAGVPWWGKRPLSLVSTAVASMASLLLGSYVFAVVSPGDVATGDTRHTASWAPLTLFVVYAFMQNIGVLPIPWMILSEVFPFRSRGLASGIAAAGSYMLAFVASKTFLSLKSALSLHGVFWLYGSLGFVGFFVIYWTFSETEGRSLEDIEEFYKTGIRGKIPRKGISEETAKGTSTQSSSSTNSVTIEREGVIKSNDEYRMVNNTSFTTQHLRNTASKSHSSNAESGGITIGTSTETIDTTFTVSTADLQDPKSSTGDVTENKDDVRHVAGEKSEEMKVAEEKRDKMKVVEEKRDKMKVVEGEKSIQIKDTEGKPSEHKTEEVKYNKAKAAEQNNGDTKGENCIQEKVEEQDEAGAEERTRM